LYPAFRRSKVVFFSYPVHFAIPSFKRNIEVGAILQGLVVSRFCTTGSSPTTATLSYTAYLYYIKIIARKKLILNHE
ncbi:MAG: hypothetical protein QNJ33_02040, partial [Crocosphaera sp.]|nr:hypothetical protein [Crocosphaera sp.]